MRPARRAWSMTSPSASSVTVAARAGSWRRRPCRADEVGEQPGRPVDAEHEHAGRHRVQRAGVADLAGAGEPPDAGDDVVAGPALPACRRRAARQRVGVSGRPRPASSVPALVARGSSSPSRRFLYGSASPAYVGAGARRGAPRRRAAAASASSVLEVGGGLGDRVGDELQGRASAGCRLLADLGADHALVALSSARPCRPARPRRRAPCRRRDACCRSPVTRTSVIVMKPSRGSLTPSRYLGDDAP